MKKLLASLLLITFLFSACAPVKTLSASQKGMEIYDARVVLPGGVALQGMQTSLAAYAMLKNASAATDRLMGVSVDFADASMHETILKGDVMTMNAISTVEVPAGQMVELRSGSYHIMLMGLTRELKPGESVNLVLNFENAGAIVVPAIVTDKQ